MRLILFIVSGMLLLSSGARAADHLKCTNMKDGGTYELTIDIQNNELLFLTEYNPYKIFRVTEKYIAASRFEDDGNVKWEVAFDRYSGELTWTVTNKKPISGTGFMAEGFICKKQRKIL